MKKVTFILMAVMIAATVQASNIIDYTPKEITKEQANQYLEDIWYVSHFGAPLSVEIDEKKTVAHYTEQKANVMWGGASTVDDVKVIFYKSVDHVVFYEKRGIYYIKFRDANNGYVMTFAKIKDRDMAEGIIDAVYHYKN